MPLLGPVSQAINTSNRPRQRNFPWSLHGAGCEDRPTHRCLALTLGISTGKQLGHSEPSKAAAAIMTILLKVTEFALYIVTQATG